MICEFMKVFNVPGNLECIVEHGTDNQTSQILAKELLRAYAHIAELERIIKESPTLSMYQDVVEQLTDRDALIQEFFELADRRFGNTDDLWFSAWLTKAKGES